MNTSFYLLMDQYTARETAFLLLALFGSGISLTCILLYSLPGRLPGIRFLAGFVLKTTIGSSLLLYLASLIILPIVQSQLF